MNKDTFFNSIIEQADELWNAITNSANTIVSKFGAQQIVDFAKARSDWEERVEREGFDGTEPVENIAYLFVTEFIWAAFSGSDLI